MLNATIINSTDNGKPVFAVVPYRDYLALLELKAKAEGHDNLEDYLDYEDAVRVLQTDTERIPYEEVLRKIEALEAQGK